MQPDKSNCIFCWQNEQGKHGQIKSCRIYGMTGRVYGDMCEKHAKETREAFKNEVTDEKNN